MPKKPSRTTLTNKCDKLFSLIVRSKRRCERCGETDYYKLQCSHIVGRTYRGTRWLEKNAQCLCAGCHLWWTHNPVEAGRWLDANWPGLYDEVRKIAEPITKPDLEKTYADLLKRAQALGVSA